MWICCNNSDTIDVFWTYFSHDCTKNKQDFEIELQNAAKTKKEESRER